MSGYDNSDDVSMFEHMVFDAPSARDLFNCIYRDWERRTLDIAARVYQANPLNGPCPDCTQIGVNPARTARCLTCCGTGYIVKERK